MEQLDSREQHQSRAASSMGLLSQGEQYLQAGCLHQAERVLTEAWKLADEQGPGFRSRTAWQMAWVKLLTHDYRGAAAWLEHVDDLPHIPTNAWFVERAAFIELCTQLMNAPALPVQPTPMPPSPLGRIGGLQPLTVRSLGAFTVTRGSVPLTICRARKAVVMFRYLLMRPQWCASRDELMEMLWPNAAPSRAAHSLHVTVSALRRYLDDQEESYLLFSAGTYAINPGAHIIHDCASFLETSDEADRYRRNGDILRAQQTYSKALAYYQGDYALDDYDLPWEVAERERLLTRYLVVLERLGAICMQRGCFDAAVECFQLILQRDEYREDTHCQIMRCYIQLGRRNDAIRQYQRCAKALADDLGLEPMPETRELYGAVLSAQSPVFEAL